MVTTRPVRCYLVQASQECAGSTLSELHAHTHQVVGEDHTQAALHRHELVLHVRVERTVLKGRAASLPHSPSGADTNITQTATGGTPLLQQGRLL
jgi:hypothetical protein